MRFFTRLRVTDQRSPRYVGDRPKKFAYQWMRLAHVCCRWRGITLDIPWLWAEIQLDKQWPIDFLHAQFDHAKDNTLSIQVALRDRFTPLFTVTCTTKLDKLRALDITRDSDPKDVQEALHTLSGSAENLEVFSVEGVHVDIPATLFAGGAPKLRHFALVNCESIPWDATLFRNGAITHLHLELGDPFSTPPIERISWAQLYSLLTAVKDTLESFKLLQSLQEEPLPEDLLSKEPVMLPQLKHITLNGFAFEISLALEHIIRFPPSTHSIIGATLDQDAYLEFEKLMSAIASARSSTLEIKDMTIEATRNRLTQLQQVDRNRSSLTKIVAYASAKPIPSDNGEIQVDLRTPIFELTLHCPRNAEVWEEHFYPFSQSELVPGVSLSHLEHLRLAPILGAAANIPDSFWEMISQLETLKSLEISEMGIGGFLKMLKEDSSVLANAIYHRLEATETDDAHHSAGEQVPHTNRALSPDQRRFGLLHRLSLELIPDLNQKTRRQLSDGFKILQRNLAERQALGLGVEDLRVTSCCLAEWKKEALELLGAVVKVEPLRPWTAEGMNLMIDHIEPIAL
mgnify:CR=1 FL=1